MAVISPFRALRYNPAKVGNIEDVVSPPYDVIDPQAQSALLSRNPYNMIRLDLSKNVKTEQMTGERYAESARLFKLWQEQQVLLREEQPSFYLYEIDYRLPGGVVHTRRGFLSRVRLADFAEGVVKRHEKTFSGVTDDRLQLLDTCQAQFSPIFSLYSDPDNRVIEMLEQARQGEPLYRAVDHDGCEHRLWVVSEPTLLARVSDFFHERCLYIADGHHRYTTALQYRDLVRQRQGELPAEHPANQTMMYLCGMEDPGLSVLPTHRLLRLPRQISVAGLHEELGNYFTIEEVDTGFRESLLSDMFAQMAAGRRAEENTRFGLYHPGEDRCLLLTLKDGVMEREASDRPAALRDLDVVVLSDLIIDRLPGLDPERCVQGDLLEYFSDPDEALDVAIKEAGSQYEHTPLLFLMNPTLVEQVKRVADEDLVMPHKSTFFYPKILTGLAINPLSD
ncbi:MAG: DUF1015 domain-containing protein [Desulfurivibrio sp.]|nr:DUF1015 domain-containing protein [Desulfurivibrio sp.]